jgi:hypothetical protein
MSVKADTVFHVGGVGEEQSVQLADPVLMCGAAKCTSNSGKSYPQQLDPQAVSWPPRMSLDVQSTSPTYYKECTYGSRERNCAFMEVPRSGTTPPERWTGVFFSPTNATQFVQPHAGVSVPIQDYKWQSREVWGWGNPYTKWENILPCPKKPRPCPQRLTVHRDWVFQYLAWDIVKSGQAYTVNRYYLVPDDNPLWPVVGSTGT